MVFEPHFFSCVTVEEEGFCYNKASVLEYLKTRKKLSSFGASLTAEEKWGHVEIKKRKHKRDRGPGRQCKFAKADDYLEAVVKTNDSLKPDTSCSCAKQFW